MAFDPPLGSTSPAVLLDNATRFDKLVNGPAATVPDRAGQPLDTWRQIVTMMLAAVTDAQNSITAIGLPFNTLSDAQAAVAAGKIPDGSVTWVRTTDSAALADEYKNINGVLTATGRRMPSQDAVDALSRQLLDSIVTGDVPGFWLALKDSAGWISWGVDDQGGFGSRAAYLGTDNILAGNIKILFTDDVGLRFQDPEGFYIDVLDNFGRYLLGDSGGGSSPVDEVSILDLKNKAYAAEVSRRVLTRLKFPTEAYNHFLMECQSLGMGYMSWPVVSKTPKYDSLMLGQSVRPA
ncbi:TPA: hypothetical protein MAK52_005222, partial [Klebsiella pneumoniae]|nr:hypothetical protein [Klebsiella pneumoniae]HBS6153002.1 hypothetical protein [Klebsiella pneumoniae]